MKLKIEEVPQTGCFGQCTPSPFKFEFQLLSQISLKCIEYNQNWDWKLRKLLRQAALVNTPPPDLNFNFNLSLQCHLPLVLNLNFNLIFKFHLNIPNWNWKRRKLLRQATLVNAPPTVLNSNFNLSFEFHLNIQNWNWKSRKLLR